MTETPLDPTEPESGTLYFRTPFVFVDTEAYRRHNFDWEAEALSGLLKLAKKRKLVLLTTYITKREVQRHLDQGVEEAAAAFHKHRRFLTLAGVDVGQVATVQVLRAKAQAAFEAFLTGANAIDVPLAVDVKNLVDDHFANKAPFSSKKTSEFKDAMVCASLTAWCEKTKELAYVVSGDPDLKAYCATAPKLIHVERIAEVLSRALASEELHEALRASFAESDDVAEALAGVIVGAPARTAGPSRHFTPGPVKADGYVTSATVQEITDVSALEISGDRFVCEVSFDADISMKLDVEDDRHYEEGSEFFRTNMDMSEPFAAVLTVRYDIHEGKLLEVVDADADLDPIELDEDKVKDAIS